MIVALCSRHFSTKREIRHFHLGVVQRRQRSVQKCVFHAQSCCFANLKLLLFCRSRWFRRRRCLSSVTCNSPSMDCPPERNCSLQRGGCLWSFDRSSWEIERPRSSLGSAFPSFSLELSIVASGLAHRSRGKCLVPGPLWQQGHAHCTGLKYNIAIVYYLVGRNSFRKWCLWRQNLSPSGRELGLLMVSYSSWKRFSHLRNRSFGHKVVSIQTQAVKLHKNID